MRRTLLPTVVLTCTIAGITPAQGQHNGQRHHALIENALSAAPASLARGATVVDHKQTVLRKGTNGWVCMPDHPDVPNNSPMCLDAPWREFIDALMSKREPHVSGIGIGYMLQDDLPVSNVDPSASAPTPHNQWVQNAGPHVMVIVSDRRLLEGLSTDPANGGPWVMWKDTPYAHIMIPAARRQP
jgi:hypothetical protein